MSANVNIGIRIRELRQARNISQGKLGDQIGLVNPTEQLCLWESGKRTPDTPTLVQIAAVLGVRIEEIIWGSEPAGDLAPYFNHISLTTGHSRVSQYGEVEPADIKALLPLFLASENEPTPLDSFSSSLRDFSITSIVVSGDTLVTLFYQNVPMITSGYSHSDDGILWDLLGQYASLPMAPRHSKPPLAPFALDRLEAGVDVHPEALERTEYYLRCMAWTVLFPHLYMDNTTI